VLKVCSNSCFLLSSKYLRYNERPGSCFNCSCLFQRKKWKMKKMKFPTSEFFAKLVFVDNLRSYHYRFYFQMIIFISSLLFVFI
jgi:hypothetical protein